MPTPSRPSFARSGAPLVAVALLSTGCSLWQLSEQVDKIERHGVASVVVADAPAGRTTFAVAWREVPGDGDAVQHECIGLHPVDGDGVAFFLLANDEVFHVGAFTDLDGDGAYDPGEPAASRGGVVPVPLEDTDDPSEPVMLSLTTTHRLPGDLALDEAPDDVGESLQVNVGELAALDEPRFTKDVGKAGMWKPFEFLEQHGLGLYFVEPYDPARTPVLFVHGISDGPVTFTDVVGGLDRARYQAWFFHYPSGFRLEKVAVGLSMSLARLRREHGFERLAVVAHSMGGLVARAAIQHAAKGEAGYRVERFVTVSTPWGGHAAATLGVEFLSNPVPAWRDLVPGSEFLQRLLETPLPDGTTHDVVFGFCTSGGLGMPNDNDGVVGVASQLEPSVQRTARSLFGLPCEHNEILHDERTIERVYTLLDG